MNDQWSFHDSTLDLNILHVDMVPKLAIAFAERNILNEFELQPNLQDTSSNSLFTKCLGVEFNTDPNSG